jgi:hypothetical protein
MTCQAPALLQDSALPLLQRRDPGVQLPEHEPLLHRNWQAAPELAHLPSVPHCCGC